MTYSVPGRADGKTEVSNVFSVVLPEVCEDLKSLSLGPLETFFLWLVLFGWFFRD